MEDDAERLLRSLVEAHTAVRWPALYLLAVHVHRTPDPISGSILTAHLLDQGVPASDAERFGAEFDRYLAYGHNFRSSAITWFS